MQYKVTMINKGTAGALRMGFILRIPEGETEKAERFIETYAAFIGAEESQKMPGALWVLKEEELITEETTHGNNTDTTEESAGR